MPLKKKPVTGMKDILPAEMQVRDYVTGLIKETYKVLDFLRLRLRVWSILRTCAANRAETTRS